MSDTTIRDLERAVAADPTDAEATERLAAALARNGEPSYWAALGTDGVRPVYWAVGASEEECERDLAAQDDPGETILVRVGAETAARIRSGDVSAMSTLEAREVVTLRLYEDADTRARIEGEGRGDADVEAHGWDYVAGDRIGIGGVDYVLVSVSGSIETGDHLGKYVLATATEVRS